MVCKDGIAICFKKTTTPPLHFFALATIYLCMQIEQLYNIYVAHPNVQTDTRKLEVGDLYFALKGENFNGNLFAAKALEAGAAYAIVDEWNGESNERIIIVKDVLHSMQQLALHHRRQLQCPVIAITGSNGKTTTKELIHAVLSSIFKTYTTVGNLNNHIGIPLTLLKIRNDAQMAVVEMGANHQKEIESYCLFTEPTHGLITNCGKAHLEGFGGEAGIRKGKGELFDYLRRRTDGCCFIMQDYDYLIEMSNGIKNIVSYGTVASATYHAKLIPSSDFLTLEHQGKKITTQLVGDYNLPNVLAAIAIGKHFGVSEGNIVTALEQYSPSNSRSQLVVKGSNQIVLDAYNANPSSMKLAIENFAKMKAANKVLLIGAMAELGEYSKAEHQNIVDQIAEQTWTAVVLVGGDFKHIQQHPFLFLEDAYAAKQWLQTQGFTDTTFLIKGSRSSKMEIVLEAL